MPVQTREGKTIVSSVPSAARFPPINTYTMFSRSRLGPRDGRCPSDGGRGPSGDLGELGGWSSSVGMCGQRQLDLQVSITPDACQSRSRVGKKRPIRKHWSSTWRVRGFNRHMQLGPGSRERHTASRERPMKRSAIAGDGYNERSVGALPSQMGIWQSLLVRWLW